MRLKDPADRGQKLSYFLVLMQPCHQFLPLSSALRCLIIVSQFGVSQEIVLHFCISSGRSGRRGSFWSDAFCAASWATAGWPWRRRRILLV